MSDDVFLYARCAVVAAGHPTWERVVADPAAMAGSWSIFDGEWLLTVAPNAFEESTGTSWSHESPVSYETGSNTAGWPDTGDSRTPGRGEGGPRGARQEHASTAPARPPAHYPWLQLRASQAEPLPWVPLYVHVQNAYMIAVNADSEWTKWWQPSARRDLEISLWLAPVDDEIFEIKKGRKLVKANIYLDGRFLLSTDRRVLLQHAHEDLARALRFAADELGLGPTPPMPAIPALPTGLDIDKPETPENQQHSWSSDWPGFQVNWTA